MKEIRLLRADEIEVRVQSARGDKKIFLLYKDARVDQRILDETFGSMYWQRSHQIIDGRLYCTVSIWDDDRKQWVGKQDVGTESNTEKEKGQASDSFKRACFNWGIGRELYTAPTIYITTSSTYPNMRVRYIHYSDDRSIDGLIITETREGQEFIVYKWGNYDKKLAGEATAQQTPAKAPTPNQLPSKSHAETKTSPAKSNAKLASSTQEAQQTKPKKRVTTNDKDLIEKLAIYCLDKNHSPEEACSNYDCVGDVVSELQVAIDNIIMERELTKNN